VELLLVELLLLEGVLYVEERFDSVLREGAV
jgi:hypothetical protein